MPGHRRDVAHSERALVLVDLQNDYFADGMTDDLIIDLAKVSGLVVIARNSVFAYKGRPVAAQEVARELGVRYVVEGSVRRAGGRVRINAQLIDVASQGHLWSQEYDRELMEGSDIQSDIATRVEECLALAAEPHEFSDFQ